MSGGTEVFFKTISETKMSKTHRPECDRVSSGSFLLDERKVRNNEGCYHGEITLGVP